MKRVRIVVSGHVQGVGFRWICAQEARAHGVMGFVRNLADGRVEAAFEGPARDVDTMVAWMSAGPEWARVESAEATSESPQGDPKFQIRS